MTSRDRFRETMRYGKPDRAPLFEDGLRQDVLEAWRKQGLSPDEDLAHMFHIDRREQVPVSLEPQPKIERWPTRRNEVSALRAYLKPNDPARFPKDWAQKVESWNSRDHILSLQIHRGIFLSMGVHSWDRLVEVVYQIKDSPWLVRDIMELYSEFSIHMIERILGQVEIDFALFSEPIGGNDRPLLSPRTYENLVLSTYRPIIEALRRHGVETIVYLTYANARVLLPSVVKAGFNCLWAMEVNTEAMDYLSIRRQFGRNLRLIGGLDLDALLRGKDAVRQEIDHKLSPLLREGGYIPLADGRVRPNVPFDTYLYYRRLLEEATSRCYRTAP